MVEDFQKKWPELPHEIFECSDIESQKIRIRGVQTELLKHLPETDLQRRRDVFCCSRRKTRTQLQ
jgi:hypothetical protein